MFSISKIKKCPVCGTNKLKDDPSIIRLETSEGTHEVPVCDECDRFFDKSAEVLTKNGNKRDDEPL
jgi:hypothetical protein